jgi:hypothetical protein
MVDTFYDQQIIQNVFKRIDEYTNTLSIRDRFKEPSIPAKFDILFLSIPNEIRIKIAKRMEPELRRLEIQKEVLDRKKQYKSGYTPKDKISDYYNLEYDIYAPFLGIVVDEFDAVFRNKENSKTLDPSRRFG